jgi:hypothetical protein
MGQKQEGDWFAKYPINIAYARRRRREKINRPDCRFLNIRQGGFGSTFSLDRKSVV